MVHDILTIAFHEACINGDLKKVSDLLCRQEQIDIKMLEKKFTLWKTVISKHTEIVKLLLENGVNAH